jgi:hypothetical protein
MQWYEVEKSADGISFSKAASVAAKAGITNAYNWFDFNVIKGVNYYRIKAISLNGETKYSAVVVVKLGSNASVNIYPNPVTGSQVNLQFNNLSKGTYTLRLMSKTGQLIQKQTIEHAGGSSLQSIIINAGMASGMYQLEISNENGYKSLQTLLKQ